MPNPLFGKFKMYFHFPQDSDWTINSYINVFEFDTMEELIEIFKQMPSIVIEKGMLFIMKDGIEPLWEDEANKCGGYFSYKISRSSVIESFRTTAFAFCGQCLSENTKFIDSINGISISPKQGEFCILKIWLNTVEFQDPTVVKKVTKSVNPIGCLFSAFGKAK